MLSDECARVLYGLSFLSDKTECTGGTDKSGVSLQSKQQAAAPAHRPLVSSQSGQETHSMELSAVHGGDGRLHGSRARHDAGAGG